MSFERQRAVHMKWQANSDPRKSEYRSEITGVLYMPGRPNIHKPEYRVGIAGHDKSFIIYLYWDSLEGLKLAPTDPPKLNKIENALYHRSALCWSLWTCNHSPSGLIIGSRSAAPDDRLSDFDLDVVDVVRYKKLLALLSSGDTVLAGEWVGLDAVPQWRGRRTLRQRQFEQGPCLCTSYPWNQNCRRSEQQACLPDLSQGWVPMVLSSLKLGGRYT